MVQALFIFFKWTPSKLNKPQRIPVEISFSPPVFDFLGIGDE